jgi:hypothetical protein
MDIDYEYAYRLWYKELYPEKDVDDAVSEFLEINAPSITLADARRALFLSTRTMAIRLKISQPTYVGFERQEKLGAVQLKTLKRAAEAMDCEFIYCVRPKERFSRLIWTQLVREAMARHHIAKTTMSPRAVVLAIRAVETMMDIDFRRRKEWTQRRPSPE